MVIPLGDDNPTRRRPWVTWLILALNLTVFVLIQPWWADACTQRAFFMDYGAVPAEIVTGEPLDAGEIAAANPGCQLGDNAGKPVYAAAVFSLFLHGGWLHLLGNMLFLWIFADNIEDRLGHVGFTAFYLLAGLIATAVFVVANPDSTTSLVGASGAIAGVLGAYLVIYPRRVVTVAVPFFFFALIRLPAMVVLGLWFVYQLLPLGTAGPQGGTGVAYLAHVAGFVFGVVVVLALGYRPEQRRRRRSL